MARATAPAQDASGGATSEVAGGAWMAIDWREHARWVEVDGRRANVVELGSGPPLLFVHGLSGCWQNWLEQLPAFAAEHRVIAVDLPGFGASELPREEISVRGYARFLDRLCDRLGVFGPIAVVGNSMGGFVAAELAIAVPQRVERLVLVAAAGISIDRVQAQPLLTLARAGGFATAWAASRHEALARRAGLRKLALALVVRHPDRLPAPLAYELMQGSGKPGFLPALQALLGYPLRDRLPQIGCPTLVVWGENDRVIPVKDAARFERLIPVARLEIFEDTGHVPMLERPERFNALLDGFLREEGSAEGADANDASPVPLPD